MLTSFFLHRIVAILFLLLFPLPFLTLIKKRNKTELSSVAIWQNIIKITNIALVAVLITGVTIYPVYSSMKFWITVVLTVAIGGLLGVTSKQLKRYNTTITLSTKIKLLKKISILGFVYIGFIVMIFGFMAHFYQI